MSAEHQIATDDGQRDDLSSPVAESREDAIHHLAEEVRKAEQRAAEWAWKGYTDEPEFKKRYRFMCLLGEAARLLEKAHKHLKASGG